MVTLVFEKNLRGKDADRNYTDGDLVVDQRENSRNTEQSLTDSGSSKFLHNITNGKLLWVSWANCANGKYTKMLTKTRLVYINYPKFFALLLLIANFCNILYQCAARICLPTSACARSGKLMSARILLLGTAE